MHQRAVHDQRDRNGVVQQREAVEQENARMDGHGREFLERVQEEDQPEDGVDCLYGELGGGEEQWEERDVAGDCERSEGAEVPAVFEREEAEGDED